MVSAPQNKIKVGVLGATGELGTVPHKSSDNSLNHVLPPV